MEVSISNDKIKALRGNIETVIRGKTEAVDLVITTLIAGGHLLIEDVPGVGKTTLAHALAKSIDASFQRIQFTSDLLPSDIIGLTIYNQQNHTFEFREGPIFANIVLADEINRATPKTQSALLEAMNEAQVSVDKVTHPLPDPFMILATQNPMEYAGTFPLPENQLDRFAMRISLGYPEAEVEREIITCPLETLDPALLTPVITREELNEIQNQLDHVVIDEDITKYLLAIVHATREIEGVRLGASTRGAMDLFRCAKAQAITKGRAFCTPDDVKSLAVPVLAHRVVTEQYGLEESTVDSSAIIERLIEKISVPI
ncbi:MAG: MoxR family ATPase [Thermodesulfobacteriota bacterium]